MRIDPYPDAMHQRDLGPEPEKITHGPQRKMILRYVLIAITVGAFTVAVGSIWLHHQNQVAWRLEALAGKVALTQDQLENLVTDENIIAYWAGPKPGYFYSIDATGKDRVLIQYVPADRDASNVIANSRIIATYFTKNGFARTVAAATRLGNTGFRNPNGSVVFYSKNRNTDIYIAFPGKEVQIEIFDPLAGQALSLAVLQDQITMIGE